VSKRATAVSQGIHCSRHILEDEDAGLRPPAPLRTAQDRATDAAALPTTRALGILPKLGHGFAQLGAIYIMAMEFEVRFDVVQ
jgi:hypothetical protein